jgi:hypothetical protein
VCRKWLNAVPIHKAKKPEKPVNNSMAEPKMKAFMSSLVGKLVKARLNVDAQRSCGNAGLIGANRQRRREFKLLRQSQMTPSARLPRLTSTNPALLLRGG